MCRCIVTILLFDFVMSGKQRFEPIWTYDNEESWPGVQCKQPGKRQSPIDIHTSTVITDIGKEFIKYGPLSFTGYSQVLVSGINNGHTVQFSSEGEEAIHPVLTGGPLEHMYRLEQLHFHWLSEHAINGVKYPMEMHFVHIRSDLTVTEALKEKDGLAIISVFCNIMSDLDDGQHIIAEEIMQYIPLLMETGSRVSGVLLDMSKLLSPNKEAYFTYAGSLTSPECNEAVIWIIMQQPIYISDVQYRLFGKVGVGRHNFRSLQRLHHHKIFRPGKPPQLRTLKVTQVFSDFYNFFKTLFRNVTTFVSNGLKSTI